MSMSRSRPRLVTAAIVGALNETCDWAALLGYSVRRILLVAVPDFDRAVRCSVFDVVYSDLRWSGYLARWSDFVVGLHQGVDSMVSYHRQRSSRRLFRSSGSCAHTARETGPDPGRYSSSGSALSDCRR